ncbi:hypothetical protein [Streptomyces sp. NPDC059949]|uniref:hypothetical protein n=1 Tax=Streptomyces sp. NPDC059949 TaxID=3347013 RepID=UPI00364C7F6F
MDRQRQYAYLAQLLAEGARPAAIVPGVTRHGEEAGRWLTTQRRAWDRLNEEQQRRLPHLGVDQFAVRRGRPTRRSSSTWQPTARSTSWPTGRNDLRVLAAGPS